MSAVFVVRGAIDVTGRGAVLLGDAVGGSIRVGMRVSLQDGTSTCVSGVEFVDAVANQESHIGLVLDCALRAADLLDAFPAGTRIAIDDAPAASSVVSEAPSCHCALRRFWFPLPTRFGIGVTAASEAEARALAAEVLARCYPSGLELGPAVADVDVSTLDAGHVLSNVGPSAVRGVWYPRLNL